MNTIFPLQSYARNLYLHLRVVMTFHLIFYLHSAMGQSMQHSEADYARPAAQMVDASIEIGEPPLPIFDPRQFGAKADGKTYDTAALQKAIDACAGTGGSVVLSHGKFLSAQLTLRSRMTFFVKTDAVLLGGRNPTDYPVLLPKGSGDRYASRSLLYANRVSDLFLDGGGIIDGQGQHLRMSGKEPDRPSIIRIFDSTNVVVRNITLDNPRMWTQIYLRCRNLVLDRLTVNSPGGYCPNLDGLDICDGTEVVISNCRINSDDDSICLKSMGAMGLNNVRVTNNIIRNTGANAIKLGTTTCGPVKGVQFFNNTIYSAALGGLCIESVDGSDVSDFVVRGLDMYRVSHPIFVRLARRTGTPGSITDVLIENVRAYETGMKAPGVKSLDSSPLCPSCTITGIPEARIGRVHLKNCYIEMPGGLSKIPPSPPEKEDKYPQSNLLGNVPAYGLYVRHADDVVLENVRFGRYAPDARPWLKVDDATVKTVGCTDLKLIKPLQAEPHSSKKSKPATFMRFKIMVALITATIVSARGADNTNATVAALSQNSVKLDSVKETPAQRDARMAWWREARFGMFIHWGLYSVAAGEWQGHPAKGNEHFMIHERVPLKEYATLAARFNPTRFGADAWVLAAKNAGMKYIVITTKHHEGFAMFRSPSSDYNIVKATPFGRDPIAELAEACRKHGVVLCFYYSLGRDWEDPDVPTNWPIKGGRSNTVDFPDEDKKVFARYFERKVKPQVRELLTQYGPVGVLWFDTPELISAAQSRELRAMIRELQPDCIVNERIGNKAGDFAVSEQKLDTDSGFHPWESCVTLSGGWGFNRFDHSWKTPEVVIRQMVDVASKGGNYLLNVGPTGEGEMPAPALERLAAIGRWMQANGEAIYGCAPWTVQSESLGAASNPAAKTAVVEKPEKTAATMKDALNDTTSQDTRPDLRFTAKGSTVYVFARSWRSGQLNVKSLSSARGIVRKVTLLGTATPITWLQNENGLALTVPERNEVEVPVTTFRVEF